MIASKFPLVGPAVRSGGGSVILMSFASHAVLRHEQFSQFVAAIVGAVQRAKGVDVFIYNASSIIVVVDEQLSGLSRFSAAQRAVTIARTCASIARQVLGVSTSMSASGGEHMSGAANIGVRSVSSQSMSTEGVSSRKPGRDTLSSSFDSTSYRSLTSNRGSYEPPYDRYRPAAANGTGVGGGRDVDDDSSAGSSSSSSANSAASSTTTLHKRFGRSDPSARLRSFASDRSKSSDSLIFDVRGAVGSNSSGGSRIRRSRSNVNLARSASFTSGVGVTGAHGSPSSSPRPVSPFRRVESTSGFASEDTDVEADDEAENQLRERTSGPAGADPTAANGRAAEGGLHQASSALGRARSFGSFTGLVGLATSSVSGRGIGGGSRASVRSDSQESHQRSRQSLSRSVSQPAIAEATLKAARGASVPGTSLPVHLRIGMSTGEIVMMTVGGVANQWLVVLAGSAVTQAVAVSAAPGIDYLEIGTTASTIEDLGEPGLAAVERWNSDRSIAVLSASAESTTSSEPLSITPSPSVRADQLRRLIETLKAYVPKPALARMHGSRESPWMADMRTITVLQIAMQKSFDRSSVQLLQDIVRTVQAIAAAHSGFLSQVYECPGPVTSMIIVFGIGTVHSHDSNYPMSAASMSNDVVRRVANRYAEIPFSFGISTGRAFCGSVGTRLCKSFVFLGPVVWRAARLAAGADALQVYCDLDTASSFDLRSGDLEVEQVSGPDLLQVSPEESPVVVGKVDHWDADNEGAAGGHDEVVLVIRRGFAFRPRFADVHNQVRLFAGRRRELRQVLNRFDEFTECRVGGLVLIEGDTGIGKSAMLHEVYREVTNRPDCIAFVATGLESHSFDPYHLLRTVFAQRYAPAMEEAKLRRNTRSKKSSMSPQSSAAHESVEGSGSPSVRRAGGVGSSGVRGGSDAASRSGDASRTKLEASTRSIASVVAGAAVRGGSPEYSPRRSSSERRNSSERRSHHDDHGPALDVKLHSSTGGLPGRVDSLTDDENDDGESLYHRVAERHPEFYEVCAYEEAPILELLATLLPFPLPVARSKAVWRAELTSEVLRVIVDLLSAPFPYAKHEVYIVDGCSHIDAQSWIVLRELTLMEQAPLVVAAVLPEFATSFDWILDDPSTVRVRLNPLSEHETLAMLLDVFHLDSVDPRVISFVRESGLGNPLFSLEFAASFLETGRCVIDGHTRRLQPAPEYDAFFSKGAKANADDPQAQSAFPITIRGVILSRADRLPPEDQLTLRLAAAIGEQMDVQTISSIFPTKVREEQVANSIMHLEQAGLLQHVSGSTYRFVQPIYQQAMYDLILPEQRTELHIAIAHFYSDVFEEAYLWRQHSPERGIGKGSAKQQKLVRAAVQLSLHWFRALMQLEDPDTELFDRALYDMDAVGHMIMQTSYYEYAAQCFTRLVSISLHWPDRVYKYSACLYAVSAGEAWYNSGGSLRVSYDHALLALSYFDAPEPAAASAMSMSIIKIGASRWFSSLMGRAIPSWNAFDDASRAGSQADLSAARASTFFNGDSDVGTVVPSFDEWPLMRCYLLLAKLYLHKREPFLMLEASMRALGHAEKGGSSALLAETCIHMAVAKQVVGDPSAALVYRERAMNLLRHEDPMRTRERVSQVLLWSTAVLAGAELNRDAAENCSWLQEIALDPRIVSNAVCFDGCIALAAGELRRAVARFEDARKFGTLSDRSAFMKATSLMVYVSSLLSSKNDVLRLADDSIFNQLLATPAELPHLLQARLAMFAVAAARRHLPHLVNFAIGAYFTKVAQHCSNRSPLLFHSGWVLLASIESLVYLIEYCEMTEADEDVRLGEGASGVYSLSTDSEEEPAEASDETATDPIDVGLDTPTNTPRAGDPAANDGSNAAYGTAASQVTKDSVDYYPVPVLRDWLDATMEELESFCAIFPAFQAGWLWLSGKRSWLDGNTAAAGQQWLDAVNCGQNEHPNPLVVAFALFDVARHTAEPRMRAALKRDVNTRFAALGAVPPYSRVPRGDCF